MCTISIGLVPLKRIESIQRVFFFFFFVVLCVAICAFMFFDHYASSCVYVRAVSVYYRNSSTLAFAWLSPHVICVQQTIVSQTNWCDHTCTHTHKMSKSLSFLCVQEKTKAKRIYTWYQQYTTHNGTVQRFATVDTISKFNGRHNIFKSIFRLRQQQLYILFFSFLCFSFEANFQLFYVSIYLMHNLWVFVWAEELVWLWIVCRCRRWRCVRFLINW